MADEALLASQRVQPEKLLNAGFRFTHPQLDEALDQLR
jgi:NAD dependent epimerase/dehydratase family enzyme